MKKYIPLFLLGGFVGAVIFAFLMVKKPRQPAITEKAVSVSQVAGVQSDRHYAFVMVSDTQKIKPGVLHHLSFLVRNDQGETLKHFAVVHEQLLHLIVVVNIVNTWKQVNPSQIYVELDQLVDQNPNARLRMEGPAEYWAANTQAIWWVQTGQISGSTIELDRTTGQSLYLATTTGYVNLTYAHSGLRLCDPLGPAQAFREWWGK